MLLAVNGTLMRDLESGDLELGVLGEPWGL